MDLRPGWATVWSSKCSWNADYTMTIHHDDDEDDDYDDDDDDNDGDNDDYGGDFL